MIIFMKDPVLSAKKQRLHASREQVQVASLISGRATLNFPVQGTLTTQLTNNQ